jgi:hypothetical protein
MTRCGEAVWLCLIGVAVLDWWGCVWSVWLCLTGVAVVKAFAVAGRTVPDDTVFA